MSNEGASGRTLYKIRRTFIPGTVVAELFAFMVDPARPKLSPSEVEQMTRLLELELIQKRASWKQAGERNRAFRAAGFVFLAFLVLACLVGGYFAFSRISEQRTNPTPAATSNPGR